MRWAMFAAVLVAAIVTVVPTRDADAAPTMQTQATRIAVLGDRDAAVAAQLEAELQLLGFEVVHADAPAQPDPAALSELARRLDVVAAVLVDAHATDLDLWVVDRVTGKTSVRRVRVEGADASDAARITAVRAIDLLRASFRELEADPTPPAAEVAPTPVVRSAARPAPSRFVLAVGPAVSGSAGGLGAMAHGVLALEIWPRGRVGLGVRGWAPFAGVRTGSAEGSATLLVGWLGVGPRVRLTRPDRTMVASLGLHVGAVFAGMRGEASAPYVGRRDLVVGAMVELDAGLGIAVHPRLRIWIDGTIGVAVPRIGIRIAGDRVATWGLPSGGGIVGLAFPL
ncbi:MAG: hypothetical protein JNK45_37365 [Myxococcales bacterium]|nr:hypothetical protein [Myxococcales bacterium]